MVNNVLTFQHLQNVHDHLINRAHWVLPWEIERMDVFERVELLNKIRKEPMESRGIYPHAVSSNYCAVSSNSCTSLTSKRAKRRTRGKRRISHG
jgi:hypothetical protein